VKPIILFALFRLLTPAANADQFNCIFEVPSDEVAYKVAASYDTKSEAIQFAADETDAPADLSNIEFFIKSAGDFILRQGGNEVMEMVLDYNFSLDLGKHLFPFSASIKFQAQEKRVDGGCYSSELPVIANPNNRY
jgi:hypothetical protein